MANSFSIEEKLKNHTFKWLVTGAAGFIGSHLVQRLLTLNQQVVGLDNLSTGYQWNLDEAVYLAGGDAASRFTFLKSDIIDERACHAACLGVDFVLHQAALGSVPRSINDPLTSHKSNVDGFINMLTAARDAKVKRFVYASSSSVYGDDAVLPKVESRVGRVLSPYAATKHINEVYAQVFEKSYGLQTVGLRYFNVFGPRQDPKGAYAAVIPLWMSAMAKGEVGKINGDGSTSRDFCFVSNAVQANIRSALAENASDTVYNVAVGDRTSLKELYAMIQARLGDGAKELHAIFQPERAGDIKDSQANIAKAKEHLGYLPTHTIAQGLDETVEWYRKNK